MRNNEFAGTLSPEILQDFQSLPENITFNSSTSNMIEVVDTGL